MHVVYAYSDSCSCGASWIVTLPSWTPLAVVVQGVWSHQTKLQADAMIRIFISEHVIL